MVAGALIFNTAGGKDALTIDLSGRQRNYGGQHHVQWRESGHLAGRIKSEHYWRSQGVVAYTYSNAHDGKVTMSSFGTVNYTGLEPVVNTGTATGCHHYAAVSREHRGAGG